MSAACRQRREIATGLFVCFRSAAALALVHAAHCGVAGARSGAQELFTLTGHVSPLVETIMIENTPRIVTASIDGMCACGAPPSLLPPFSLVVCLFVCLLFVCLFVCKQT